MPTADPLVLQADTPDRWERAPYAFLAEKERRSDSGRPVRVLDHKETESNCPESQSH